MPHFDINKASVQLLQSMTGWILTTENWSLVNWQKGKNVELFFLDALDDL